MSAPMKKPRISNQVEILIRESDEKFFRVSREQARGLVLLLDEFRVKKEELESKEVVSAHEVFRELDEKFGRAGAAIQGARLKEGFSQVELARQLRISQSDLSKMEHGKRSIGKQMARKLAKALRVDYRAFL